MGIGKPPEIEFSDLKVPDSSLIKHVEDFSAEVSSKSLFNHCVRTFYFGDALGKRDGLDYDREILYLAALMHDLGLTEKFNGTRSFEIESAKAARKLLAENEYDEEKSDLIHEMIVWHTSAGVASKKGTEFALLHFGAGVDVVGMRFQDIAKGTIEKIIEEKPRLDFKKEISRLMLKEKKNKPDSHIVGTIDLGFVDRIKIAPFTD